MLDGLIKGLPPQVEALSVHILRSANIDPDEVRQGSAEMIKAAEAAGSTATVNAADDASLPMGVRVRKAVESTLAEVVPRWVDLGVLGADEAGIAR